MSESGRRKRMGGREPVAKRRTRAGVTALPAVRLDNAALAAFLRERRRWFLAELSDFKVIQVTRTDEVASAEVVETFRYRVHLILQHGQVTSRCSCPWGAQCPHGVALARVLLEEGSHQSPSPEQEDPGEAWIHELPWPPGHRLSTAERMQLHGVSQLWRAHSGSHLDVHLEGHLLTPADPRMGKIFARMLRKESLPISSPLELIIIAAGVRSRSGETLPPPLDALNLDPEACARMAKLIDEAEMAHWSAFRANENLAGSLAHMAKLSPAPPPPQFRLRIKGHELFLEAKAEGKETFREVKFTRLRSLLEGDPRTLAMVTPIQMNLLCLYRRENPDRFHGPPSYRLITALLRDPDIVSQLLVDEQGQSGFTHDPRPCSWRAERNPDRPDRLCLRKLDADGEPLPDTPIYSPVPGLIRVGFRLLEDAPMLPHPEIPARAWEDPHYLPRLIRMGVRSGPPDTPIELVDLCLALEIELMRTLDQRFARLRVVACTQEGIARESWDQTKWKPLAKGAAKPTRRIELAPDPAPALRLAHQFGYAINDGFVKDVGPRFAQAMEEFLSIVPPDLSVLLGPELAAFQRDPDRATLEVTVSPVGEGAVDWFDLRVELRPEDLELTAEEVALLAKAQGSWVELPGKGWRRMEVVHSEAAAEALAELGVVNAVPGMRPQRVHALQLAGMQAREDSSAWRQVRDRLAALEALPEAVPPPAMAAVLRPYQRDGFCFLATQSNRGLGALLADDMGLGKTVQALAWLLDRAAAAQAADETFRALIVCPKSVRTNWLREAARFTPELPVADWSGQAKEALPGQGLVITGYTQVRTRASVLGAVSWTAVVLDEAQFIKNPDTATAKVASALHARHRVLLTGTPIENRTLDLWSLFAFLQPGLFGTQKEFRALYGDRAGPEAWSRLARRIRPFLLRRTKNEVELDLPPRTEEDLLVDLEPEQRRLYDAELKETRRLLSGLDAAAFRARRMEVLRRLLRLRQLCCAPALLGAGDVGNAKLDCLLETLVPLLEEGHRVLVFSQFVRVLELISQQLGERGIPHLILTGKTEDRGALVNRFQAADAPPVFLLSLRAAGTGLNLTAADYVFLFDPWWNPAVEAQAIDRTHRIGQSRPVIAYRLLARSTIEEKIRLLQQKKAELAEQVISGGDGQVVLDLDTVCRLLQED